LIFIQPDHVSFMMQGCSTLSFFCSFILLFPEHCTDISRLLTRSVVVFLPFFLTNLLRLFQILQIFIFSFFMLSVIDSSAYFYFLHRVA
jgi:hypothetical protein